MADGRHLPAPSICCRIRLPINGWQNVFRMTLKTENGTEIVCLSTCFKIQRTIIACAQHTVNAIDSIASSHILHTLCCTILLLFYYYFSSQRMQTVHFYSVRFPGPPSAAMAVCASVSVTVCLYLCVCVCECKCNNNSILSPITCDNNARFHGVDYTFRAPLGRIS